MKYLLIFLSLISTNALAAESATYYADKFEGRKTANGEIYSHSKFTAAHNSLPIGTKVKVTHSKTGKSVIVRINDRMPGKGIIDLSKGAAKALGIIRIGRALVKLTIL